MSTLIGMSTQGDRWLSAPLSEIGGKGLFIKELEAAMIDGRADVAVHSMKDVPADLPGDFALPAIGFRDEVRDVLVSARAGSVAQLPHRRASWIVESAAPGAIACPAAGSCRCSRAG